MKPDLADMEHMIDEYLAFARGEGGEAIDGCALSPDREVSPAPSAPGRE